VALTPLEQIIERLGGDRGQELVQRLNIPEDAGQFVIVEKANQPTAWKVVNNLKYVNPWVPLAAIGCFGLALVAAKDRRKMLIWIGATVAVIAALSFTLLALPLKNLLTSWPPTSEGQLPRIYVSAQVSVQNALPVVFGGCWPAPRLWPVIAVSPDLSLASSGVIDTLNSRRGSASYLGFASTCLRCVAFRPV
jgi:hypothetical protein